MTLLTESRKLPEVVVTLKIDENDETEFRSDKEFPVAQVSLFACVNSVRN